MATLKKQTYSLDGELDGESRIEPSPLSGLGRHPAVATVGLGLIVLLGAFLRLYHLGAGGIGNSYYAAAVDSMLKSWHNFFFVSFEPGGSVSVDKPPLDLWAQTASAYFLGVNGFALALPQALAGVLSIPLLYGLVKRQFGVVAALVAALVLAVMPVTVATDRYNTMDGLLVFVLLLATWAFWSATRSGRLRILLLGAFLVGVAFNVKMLEAFMPLPAFYALYLWGAPHSWRKRVLHLAAATAVLLVVSLSWAVAVDLTPPQDRPYVGSSSDNSEIELIVGHNGIARLMPTGWFGDFNLNLDLFGGNGQSGQLPQNRSPRADGSGTPGFDLGGRTGNFAAPRGGGGFGSFGSGQPGPLRLFGQPLVTQASWLLPLALLAIPLLVVQVARKGRLNAKQQALVLWGGSLLAELAYFSFTQGMFQSYYLIMMGPPLAALVGAAVWSLGQILQRRRWLGWVLAGLVTGGVLLFQAMILRQYPEYARWMVPAAAAIWLIGVALMAWRPRPWLGRGVLGLAIVGLVIAPAVWSGLTTFGPGSGRVTQAGPAQFQRGFGGTNSPAGSLPASQQQLLNYLLANSNPKGYLVAVDSATEAESYILATGRPVLTFGGFNGSDNVVNAQQLAQMVKDGQVRFVLADSQLTRQKPDVARWLAQNARPVQLPGAPGAQTFGRGGFGGGFGGGTLYDCQPS